MVLLQDYYTVQKTRMFGKKLYALLAVYSTEAEARHRISEGERLSRESTRPTKNIFELTKRKRGYYVWWRQELKKKMRR